MLDAIFFLQLLQLLFDTIKRYANDLGKLLARQDISPKLIRKYFPSGGNLLIPGGNNIVKL